ncbi:hypothetical protein JZU46_07375 [bacterium]|jgi:hypothetical protein|nr:hypothetical protein [bacterium]
MSNRAKSILLALENLREDLLGLSDDIWLDVDHNDSEKLRQAFEFKTRFNEQLAHFSQNSTALAALVQSYTGASENGEVPEPESVQTVIEEREAIQDAHSLERSFTYTRPYGYILDGKTFTGARNWIRLYMAVCKQLHTAKRDVFRDVATSRKMVTSHGNKMFSSEPSDLRDAKPLGDGFYAEGNLSANTMRDCLKKLLPGLGTDVSNFRVLLRHDPQSYDAGGNFDLEDIVF